MLLTALDESAGRKRGEGPEVRRLLLEAAARRHPGWPLLAEFAEAKNKR